MTEHRGSPQHLTVQEIRSLPPSHFPDPDDIRVFERGDYTAVGIGFAPGVTRSDVYIDQGLDWPRRIAFIRSVKELQRLVKRHLI